MTLIRKSLLALLLVASAWAADRNELESRRQRAAATCPDGILLVHARSAPDEEADGFRQDPAFYYFAAAKATVVSVLAGIRAVKPGASRRTAEWAMVAAGWQAGARFIEQSERPPRRIRGHD